jgi:enoyl-CoA hydratase/carnithine racemase
MNAPTAARAPDAAAPVLLRERDKSVATLVLNRPQPRNSLSDALLTELSGALADIASDRTVRAVIIAANGPAFCAGHDLKELTRRRSDPDGGRDYFRKLMVACSAMMQQIVNLPQPVIAAVQGAASAAGCQLVARCDIEDASREENNSTRGDDNGCVCTRTI